MSGFRVSRAAADDIGEILEWSEEHLGAEARVRYDALIRAALRHASSDRADARFKQRPELGWEGDLLAVGRVRHERMDPTLHVDLETDWT